MKVKLLDEIFKWGVLSAIIAVALPDLAIAQTATSGSLNTVLNKVRSEEVSAIPAFMGAVCYVGGAFLLVAGALSLKKHAENPASEPMAKGIARLAVGGAITAVPGLTQVIQGSTKLGTTAATYTTFAPSFGG